VRGDEAEEDVEPAVGGHQPGRHADVEGVLPEDVHDREAEEDTQDQAARGDPGVVGPDLGGEGQRRVG
jgi:hypothetical protein